MFNFNSSSSVYSAQGQVVDPGGPVVIIPASGLIPAGVDAFFFSERKNCEYDFLRKGSKAVGPVS